MYNSHQVGLSECGFIEIDLENGENVIVSTFKFPFLKETILAGAFGIFCLVIVIIINKCLIKYSWVRNTLYVAGLTVGIVFLAVVYFAPSVVFVVRLCLLKF